VPGKQTVPQPRLMLFRFCLYGFLKNQQYYDPFLILAFRQKDLSFAMIGILIGFREICINLMEIPAGAVADVLGRRRSMIASFLAYIGSFIVFGAYVGSLTIFGLSVPFWMLFAAMFLFAVGEAFRTGTHKAIIFDWLERQGRVSEKTSVYGRTRSWSKLGSAVSVVIATGLVFSTEQYWAVFLVCIIPYSMNVVNFLTYPSYLDGPRQREEHSGGLVRTVFSAVGQSLRHRPLRRLLIESMGYEGLYKSCKDYVQPVIKAACLSLPVMAALADRRQWAESQQVAIAVGAVYFVLYLLGSFASRGAGSFAKGSGGEDRAARVLWLSDLTAFTLMAAGIYAGLFYPGLAVLSIVAFVLLAVFQNLWRPILIGRVASHADSDQMGTILSIESQAKSLFVAIIAPLLGWSVDLITRYDEGLRFMPIAVLGIAVSAVILLIGPRSDSVPATIPE